MLSIIVLSHPDPMYEIHPETKCPKYTIITNVPGLYLSVLKCFDEEYKGCLVSPQQQIAKAIFDMQNDEVWARFEKKLKEKRNSAEDSDFLAGRVSDASPVPRLLKIVGLFFVILFLALKFVAGLAIIISILIIIFIFGMIIKSNFDD